MQGVGKCMQTKRISQDLSYAADLCITDIYIYIYLFTYLSLIQITCTLLSCGPPPEGGGGICLEISKVAGAAAC